MSLKAIQTIPVAIYNLIQMSSDSEEGIIVVNVGNENTDFIVAELPLGQRLIRLKKN